MNNKLKIYLRFIFYLTCTSSLLVTSCSKDNNPVTSEENITSKPFDPDAPKIKSEWEDWIKVNSNEIKSLDSPDYSDLYFLNKILQNKKIVQLGESSHGVKEFNKAKVRLVKYLHEKMGYNIMAFESSVFDCFYANANEGKNGPTAMMVNSIFGVWFTEEVKELFSYIIQTQTTGTPLILVGFDIQPSSNGRRHRPKFLKNVFENISSENGDKLFQLDTFFQSIKMDDPNVLNSIKDSLLSEYQSYLDLLDNNWNKVIKSYPENSPIPHIAKLSIRSNIKFINQYYYHNSGMYMESTEERDSNMAYNLEYLYKNLYSNEKIIIWAHNYHVRYNSAKVKNTYNSGANSMGYYLRKNFSNELYTVGLFMYRGKVASNARNALDVTKSSAENIEAILYYSGYYYSFVDMLGQNNTVGNSWMFNEMKAKYWGIQDQLLVPKEQYDAILYIYETHLPDYLNYQFTKMNWEKLINLNYYR